MHIKNLNIIGAGGHARVVIDAARRTANINIIIYDDQLAKEGHSLDDALIHAPIQRLPSDEKYVHIAIGNNKTREKLGNHFINQQKILHTVIHPQTYIAGYTKISEGSFIACQAIIGPGTLIHSGCIINHSAVVDHECVIGAWSHIAPNATLGGNVKIGQRVLIGAGAIVLPGIKIADDVIVGAGAVVTKDIEAGLTLIGNPACKID